MPSTSCACPTGEEPGEVLRPCVATPVGPGGCVHPRLLQQLLDGQVRPQSLHEAVEDVSGAPERLLLLCHAGLRYKGDVLHVLERGAQPGREQ